MNYVNENITTERVNELKALYNEGKYDEMRVKAKAYSVKLTWFLNQDDRQVIGINFDTKSVDEEGQLNTYFIAIHKLR